MNQLQDFFATKKDFALLKDTGWSDAVRMSFLFVSGSVLGAGGGCSR
jgi:hypothetical protein